MRTLSERFAEEFRAWEWRGRGWRSWSHPVTPEPPFRPFPGYYQFPAPIPDEGRKRTLLSSLVRRVSAALSPAVAPLGAEAESESEPEEISRARIVEVQAYPPVDLRFDPKDYANLFVGLSGAAEPISFEIWADSRAAKVQFAVSPDDAPLVLRQLNAFFPEADFIARRSSFSEEWESRARDEAAVVEFGLAREFVIPLTQVRAEPFVALLGALAGLRDGEIAVYQVLFEPVRHPWARSIARLVANEDGKPIFQDAPELVSGAERKTAVPVYAVVVRIAAIAESFGRSCSIVGELATALGVLASPAGNELVPVGDGGYRIDDCTNDVPLRQSRRFGMILSEDELVALVHLPSSAVRSEILERQTRRTKRAPAICLGHGFVLGTNHHLGEETLVSLSHDQRTRHMHLVGASGTGKSTLMLNLILQDIAAGEGVAVIDPHGDLVEAITERIPENRIGDVVMIDPSDEEYPVGLNLVEAHSDLEKNLLASDLVSVFRRLSTSWGDQLNSILANAILAFLESDSGGTLLDLRRFLVEPGFRAEFVKTVRDPEIAYYWTHEFPFLSGKPQGPVLTRLDIFLRPKAIRNMISQRKASVDFADMMNSGKILLVKLSQGLIGEENAFLLGSLLVGKIHQTAIARQAVRESERRCFWLYADEFHHYVTPSMATILSGARKYRLGLTLAHQELRQIEGRDADVASAVLANPFTRICFRVGDSDARKLAPGFSSFESKDLMNLGVGEAICRVERADYDFNLSISRTEGVDGVAAESVVSRVIAASRAKYAVRRADVEAARHTVAPSSAAAVPVAPKVNLPLTPAAELAGQVVPVIGRGRDPIEILPPKPSPIPRTPGKGGREHKRLQELVKDWAEALDWRAVLEAPAGAGSADVLLTKDSVTVACEISVTTGTDHEVANLQKCLAAGFTYVVSVSESERRSAQIEEAAKKVVSRSEEERLRFVTMDGLFRFVEELDAKSRSTERTVRGIKVKVAYRTLSAEAAAERQARLAEVVARAMKRK